VKASLATVAIALLVLGAGCSGDDGDSEDPGGTTAGTEAESPSEDLSSYETVADLNEALAAGGVECALEYEGLVDEDKEISQCTIDGSQAFVTIWFDESFVTDIVAPEGAEPPAGVAYGRNWTIELTPPTPATATAVADAAGGATTDA
jgi:hypothetical protein